MKLVQVFSLPAILVRHRELLGSFIWRDLKARYEGSLLGRLWPILNPLILFCLFYFVFAIILGAKLEARGTSLSDAEAKQMYGLYIISGILPWLGFSEGLTRCTGVVLENGNLVKKIAFPSELLPVYAVVVNLVYFFIGLAVYLVAVTVFFGGLPSTWWWLLVAIPLQAIFTIGLGLFLGAFNIFVRDTSQIMGLILQLWFFTTPIVYHVGLIEGTDAAALKAFMGLNPLYHLMDLYRTALVPKGYEQLGPVESATIYAAMAFVTFVLGYSFYLATKGRFADEL